MASFTSFLGLIVLLFLCWLLSNNKKRINYRLVFSGLVLQFIFALLVLKTAAGKYFFSAANDAVTKVLSFSDAGAAMIFGENFKEHFFAFSVLPTIIFVSALFSVLFYIGIIQYLIKFLAYIMVKVMDVSGAESLSVCADIFVGQTEAPLVVKPYIPTMTRTEIMSMMVGGMASIAGGVMAAYVSFGVDAGHLLAASIMSAPAALICANIIIPETETSVTKGKVKIELEKSGENVLDAACAGAGDGLKLALNVGAMIIAFIALTTMLNYFIGYLPDVAGAPLSIERILGWIFAPIAYICGVDFKDISAVGTLIGQKMLINEFVAYLSLKDLKGVISERSFTIATYALCGFANFSSIAIQIGGTGALVPSRRSDIAKLGFKAMIGATIATLMTATFAGMLL